MERFVLEFQNGDLLENAGAKAPMDISTILVENGFHKEYFKTGGGNIFKQFCSMFLSLIRLAFSAKRGSVLVFQYPIYSKKGFIAFQSARRILKLRKVTVVCLIHDLLAARFGTDMQEEVAELKKNDFLIVHSPQMASLLADSGCTAPTIVLGLFDYLVKRPNCLVHHLSYETVFAGNLSKSVFLCQLTEITNNSPMLFRLYGRNNLELNGVSGIEYGGLFSPDDVSTLNGSWGLVWDGDSIYDLTGRAGEYQKINSPHKASLYLVAGLPLIVNTQAAIATIVEEEHIGITVKSLSELPDRIQSMTEEDYQFILGNVRRFASKLTSGKSILNALEKVF